MKKRVLSVIFACLLCVPMLAGCGKKPVVLTEEELRANELKDAKLYIYNMYKDAADKTPEEYTVVSKVNVNGNFLDVTWTTDSELAVPAVGEKYTKVQIDEEADAETKYVLTATISNKNGETVSVSFNHTVPEGAAGDMSVAEVLDKVFALKDGEALKGVQVLRGTISRFYSEYNAEKGYCSPYIMIGDKEMECYKLVGGEDLAVGDEITVTGVVKNYKGTFEFDAGCTYSKDKTVEEAKQLLVLDKIFALKDGETLKGTQVLRGTISRFYSEYNAEKGYCSPYIMIGDKEMECYKLVGGEGLAIGDEITVTGVVKNYKGTFEFDAGCVYSKEKTIEEAKQDLVLDKAFALKDGEALKGKQVITGTISRFYSEYNAEKGYCSPYIMIGDKEMECYKLVGGEDLAVGDKITVSGIVKNYKGTIEFDAGCTYVK